MNTEPLAPNTHSFERGRVYTLTTAALGTGAEFTSAPVRFLRTVGDAHLFVAAAASTRKTKADFLIVDQTIVTIEQH